MKAVFERVLDCFGLRGIGGILLFRQLMASSIWERSSVFVLNPEFLGLIAAIHPIYCRVI